MSPELRFAATVLRAYRNRTGDNPADSLEVTPFDRASRTEGVAETAYRLLGERGTPLPSPWTVTFAARVWDDGSARLVVTHAHRVLSNRIWPTTGSLRAWTESVTRFVFDLQRTATTLPSTETPQ